MQPLANEPETANFEPGAETREPSPSDLDAVAALLAGDEPDQGESGDADGQADESQGEETTAESETTKPKPAKPENLAQLAETLGVEVADLYAIEIPFDAGDGESKTRTLGEIKDAIANQDSLEIDRLAFEETRRDAEKEFRKNSQDLSDIVAALPRAALSKDLLQKIAKKRAELVEHENRMTLNTIREWNDQDVEARDRQAMQKHLSEYGFPADYLDSLVDHRTLAFLRDATQRKARIESALAQVRKVSSAGHKPSTKPSKKAAPKTIRRARRVNSQINQVADLLNSD